MIVRAAESDSPKAHCAARAIASDTAVGEACIYCGGQSFSRLYQGVHDRLGFVVGDWAFDRCGECEAALLMPRPASDELGSFYPPVYTFAPELAQKSLLRRTLASIEYHGLYRPMYGSQARQIARLSGGASGKPLLDIGCGRGLRLLELKRHGFEVHGVDFDADAAEYLRSEHDIPAIACDVLEIDQHFAASSFDTITAYYVVEHVVELRRLLESCFSLLRPGGRLIAAVPLIDGLQPKLFGNHWCQVREAPRHISLPSVAAMKTALQIAGFLDVAVESDSYLLSASSAALSMVSTGTTHSAYGSSAIAGLATRLLAIGAAAASLPLSVWEDRVAHKPSLGVFAARRPL